MFKLFPVQLRFAPVCAALAIAGCATPPGPSVPMQKGHDLQDARDAVITCAAMNENAGRSAVTGGYIAGVLFGGIVLGPIIVSANSDNIYEEGERSAVDDCLAEKGFVRRELTAEEVDILNRLTREQRHLALDHLVGGGDVHDIVSRFR